MKNYDLEAARAANAFVAAIAADRKLLPRAETLTSKAAEVLLSQGPYAVLLFLATRTVPVEQQVAQQVAQGLLQMAETLSIPLPPGEQVNGPVLLSWATEVVLAEGVSRIALVREGWYQLLIYIRFRVKAERVAGAQGEGLDADEVEEDL